MSTSSSSALVDQEQLIANNGHDVNILTDGSKIEGKVGAALSVWSGAAETKTLKLVLPCYFKVYQAELLAIYRAARMTSENLVGSVGIYSDSLSPLQTLQNPKALHHLAIEAQGFSAWCFTPEETCKFVLDQSPCRTGGERACRSSGQGSCAEVQTLL
ncbi:unnamed protein product [Euphydryas editha]|uniref:RNase H type-1 domain-containing protein n=1 Tax=Euphydryas editha TaxID=104508 RepID=A0AAU9UIG5_EUPED|nr:unnamed protein product [Euphydryas editha]